ncbi:MAG: sodium:proton antiporter [Desulfurococcales archaeon ex4484_58]|nr:MAG: sodium:proton antiporter [Desulfurococcales archaeon ex4484_58]
MRHSIAIVSLVLFVLSMALLLTLAKQAYIPRKEVRDLAKIYLNTTYNPWNKKFTAMSPEGVTAIVWDYRGLDTVFETAVFYLAIIGSIALARGIGKYSKPTSDEKKLGLSLIVKTVTRITTVSIIAVAVSIALHGHLTPGGGFQGGATAAVAPLLILIAFSQYFLLERGVSKDLMLVIRSLGLAGIGLTAIAAYFIGVAMNKYAFVLQNQAKPLSEVSIPAYIDGQLISGTLWFFNISEFFAVMAGFTIVLILLVIPERAFKSSGGEEK